MQDGEESEVIVWNFEPKLNEHAGAPIWMSNILITVHLNIQTVGKIFGLVQPVLKISTSTMAQRLVKQNANRKHKPGRNPRKSGMGCYIHFQTKNCYEPLNCFSTITYSCAWNIFSCIPDWRWEPQSSPSTTLDVVLDTVSNDIDCDACPIAVKLFTPKVWTCPSCKTSNTSKHCCMWSAVLQ